jgi:hypothetical protein
MDVRLGLPRIDGELQPARGEVRRRTGGSCIANCEFAARGAAHCGLAPAPPAGRARQFPEGITLMCRTATGLTRGIRR